MRLAAVGLVSAYTVGFERLVSALMQNLGDCKFLYVTHLCFCKALIWFLNLGLRDRLPF